MVAMATNSNITVPQNYTTKYSNLVHGWDTSHPTTISKRFIILIYHYLHAVHTDKASIFLSKRRAFGCAGKGYGCYVRWRVHLSLMLQCMGRKWRLYLNHATIRRCCRILK